MGEYQTKLDTVYKLAGEYEDQNIGTQDALGLVEYVFGDTLSLTENPTSYDDTLNDEVAIAIRGMTVVEAYTYLSGLAGKLDDADGSYDGNISKQGSIAGVFEDIGLGDGTNSVANQEAIGETLNNAAQPYDTDDNDADYFAFWEKAKTGATPKEGEAGFYAFSTYAESDSILTEGTDEVDESDEVDGSTDLYPNLTEAQETEIAEYYIEKYGSSTVNPVLDQILEYYNKNPEKWS